MSPRTFDDIPVSTVFAEEKSREIQTEFDNSTERKISSDSNRSSSSRNRKISRDSKRSEKSQQQIQQSLETAKKLKKELEDTIRNNRTNYKLLLLSFSSLSKYLKN